MRRVEDITEALRGTRTCQITAGELNQKIYAHIDTRRHQPSDGKHLYVRWMGCG